MRTPTYSPQVGNQPGIQFPVVTALIAANVVVFFGEWFLGTGSSVREHLALFPQEILAGDRIWTIFSYMFLHGSTTHLALNMAGLWMLGAEIEVTIGRGRFLLMYLLSGLAGGIGFVLVASMTGLDAPCVGASGAICGILGALVAMFPNRRLVIVFLPWFPMRAWVLTVVLATIHLFFILTPYGGRVAYDVHLFGGLAGYLFCLAFVFRHRKVDPHVPVATMSDPDVEELVLRVLQSGRESLSVEERRRWDTLRSRFEPESGS